MESVSAAAGASSRSAHKNYTAGVHSSAALEGETSYRILPGSPLLSAYFVLPRDEEEQGR